MSCFDASIFTLNRLSQGSVRCVTIHCAVGLLSMLSKYSSHLCFSFSSGPLSADLVSSADSDFSSDCCSLITSASFLVGEADLLRSGRGRFLSWECFLGCSVRKNPDSPSPSPAKWLVRILIQKISPNICHRSATSMAVVMSLTG